MTTHIRQSNDEAYQELLRQCYEGVPQWEPTAEDLNRMAAEYEERFTEGRAHRPRIPNPHWD